MNDWDRFSVFMKLSAAEEALQREPRKELKRMAGSAPMDLVVTLGIVVALGIPVALILLGVF
jgi:hypothetical protein